MRTANFLFKLPEDNELKIAAMAAINMYVNNVKMMGVPTNTTIIVKENWLTDIIIPSIYFVSEDIEETCNMTFDLAIDLNDERINDIGVAGGRTAAQVCGSILGISDINELVKIKVPEDKYDLVIIVPYKDFSELIVLPILEAFPHEKVNIKLSDDIKDILEAKIVFGPRSVETYLAACADKAILECYTLDKPKDFLSKWHNPKYNMLCVESLESIEKNIPLVIKTLERMIQKYVISK